MRPGLIIPLVLSILAFPVASAHAGTPTTYAGAYTVTGIEAAKVSVSTGKVTDPVITFTVRSTSPGTSLKSCAVSSLVCRTRTITDGSYALRLSELTGIRLNAVWAMFFPSGLTVDMVLRRAGAAPFPEPFIHRLPPVKVKFRWVG